jgi:hypothetical protein
MNTIYEQGQKHNSIGQTNYVLFSVPFSKKMPALPSFPPQLGQHWLLLIPSPRKVQHHYRNITNIFIFVMWGTLLKEGLGQTRPHMGGVHQERLDGLEYNKDLSLDRWKWKLTIQIPEPWLRIYPPLTFIPTMLLSFLFIVPFSLSFNLSSSSFAFLC